MPSPHYNDQPYLKNLKYSNLKEKKGTLAAFAAALARVVLEHPGGPWRRIPRIGVIPNLENAAGCFIGHSIACSSFVCPRKDTLRQ